MRWRKVLSIHDLTPEDKSRDVPSMPLDVQSLRESSQPG